MSFLALALLTSVVLFSSCDDLNETSTDDSLIVHTTKGRVRGVTVWSVEMKKVDVFYGIPYAKPPVGELRFRHPKPADPWTGILDSTTLPNTCLQVNYSVSEDIGMFKDFLVNSPLSEDCLTLNVWVPNPRSKGASVMLWIHGGSFAVGGPNLAAYDPRALCSEEQVVVVSIAYRVSSLGFLFLDRPDVPGNMGLLDQRLAFEWVRDNIERFGGDPQKVTLFGQSAGAASVSLHLLSPLSRDLFDRAIVISGAIPAPWMPMNSSANVKNSLKFAELLHCPNDPSDMDAVVDCLRSKDPVHIVVAEKQMGLWPLPFLPIVDGHFLTEPIEETLAAKNFKKTELLIGVTSEDGAMMATSFLPRYFNLREDIPLPRKMFMSSVKEMLHSFGKMVHEAVFFEYTDWNDPENPVTNRDAVISFFSDYYFICPAEGFASSYAEAGSDVFMYIFSHIPSVNALPRWMGSLHNYDIPFFFGQALMPHLEFGEDEKQLSRTMMRYYANFARTGNPNRGPEESLEPIVWPLHTIADRKYLNLNAKSIESGKNYKSRKCAFWQGYFPKLMHCESKSSAKCISHEQVCEAIKSLYNS